MRFRQIRLSIQMYTASQFASLDCKAVANKMQNHHFSLPCSPLATSQTLLPFKDADKLVFRHSAKFQTSDKIITKNETSQPKIIFCANHLKKQISFDKRGVFCTATIFQVAFWLSDYYKHWRAETPCRHLSFRNRTCFDSRR